MHINVRDILAESVGYNRAYTITGERPELSEVNLAHDITGEITIARLDSSLLVRGHITTELELECHRCLRSFVRPARVTLAQEYALVPTDDQQPIEDDEIDLAPLVEQELILDLPLQILCRVDCPGLAEVAAEYNPSTTTNARLASRARITKGTQRGRT